MGPFPPFTPPQSGAADAPAQPAPPSPEAAAAPEPAPVAPVFGWDDSLGLLVHGAPLINFDNPYGGQGFGILTAVDVDATHERDQKKAIAGTFPPEYEPIPKSGGAAHYFDFLTGRGWSVALNPEDA